MKDKLDKIIILQTRRNKLSERYMRMENNMYVMAHKYEKKLQNINDKIHKVEEQINIIKELTDGK